MFCASEGDIVLTSKIPSQKFLKEMKDAGINMVEFIEYKNSFKELPKINKTHLAYFSPWAFTHRTSEIDSQLKNTKEKLLIAENSGFLKFYDKTNFPFLRSEIREEVGENISYHKKYDGIVCKSLDETRREIEKLLTDGIETVVIKEATAFRIRDEKISSLDEISENISNWITAA